MSLSNKRVSFTVRSLEIENLQECAAGKRKETFNCCTSAHRLKLCETIIMAFKNSYTAATYTNYLMLVSIITGVIGLTLRHVYVNDIIFVKGYSLTPYEAVHSSRIILVSLGTSYFLTFSYVCVQSRCWCRLWTDGNFASSFPALGLVWQVTWCHQQAQQHGAVGTTLGIVPIWNTHIYRTSV